MSMNRAIHGAVRRDLDRFVRALEAFPPGDSQRGRQLLTAWKNFEDQLTRHHEGEHEIAWPALKQVGVSGDLLAELDAEHDVMAAALVETRHAMRTLANAPGVVESRAAAEAMRGLRTVTVAHLKHEEAEIEPILLAKANSEPIKRMGREFGKVSPTVGGRFFAWVLDGATDDERAAITRDVPGPVLTLLGGVFGRGYRRHVAPVWNGAR